MTMPKNLSPEQKIEWKKNQVLRVKQWSIDNPEKVACNKRKHYENNKTIVISAAKEWRKNNPELAKESVVRYQEKHKTEILERSRQNYQNNRDKL